jgi:calcineurin-like phosphoesterase
MSVIQTTAKPSIKVLSFDHEANLIVRTLDKADQAYIKATGAIASIMQQYVDHWFLTNGRDKASVKALGESIRNSQAVIDLAAKGACEKKTFTEYAQSAMRALHWNVPFEASLKNKPEFALPGGKAKTSDVGKAGPVTSITRDAADKTLSKALAQYRALGLTEFAANLLDVALDSLEGFKETILDK